MAESKDHLGLMIQAVERVEALPSAPRHLLISTRPEVGMEAVGH